MQKSGPALRLLLALRVFAAALTLAGFPAAAAAFGKPGAQVWLPQSVTTTAPAIDKLFYAILAITGVVFILVQATLLLFLFLYRKQPGKRAHYIHGNNFVEVVWTAIPTVILVALAFQSQKVWALVRGAPPAADLEIEVLGEQFAWNVRYPGEDAQLNTEDDILTINQLHMPADKTTLIHIKSKDVIHSFFVPQFRMKQDAVPGITSRMWVKPTEPGNFEIACAELCGLGHYRMRGFLVIEPAEAFDAWLVQAKSEM